ncbi:MAG: PHP domain-containing protein [Desulfatibacillum sp.]|nr:PHP domain-containing protein [Desulfatibacillum sp.]
MIMDLHVHTTVSPCSNLTMDEILANARYLGLDGVCVTDHYRAGELSSKGDFVCNGLVVIVGTEYATPQGDLLLFGPHLDFPDNLSAPEVLSRVEAQGGAGVLAHPFRKKRPGAEELVSRGLVTAVEEINGRNTPEENLRVAGWLAKYPLHTVAGSDAHSLEELGRVATYFSRPVHGWKDLAAALKAGDMIPQISAKLPPILHQTNNQLNCA